MERLRGVLISIEMEDDKVSSPSSSRPTTPSSTSSSSFSVQRPVDRPESQSHVSPAEAAGIIVLLKDKSTAHLKKLSYGLSINHCDLVLVSQKVCVGVYNGVTTSKLDELATETAAAAMTANHPYYASLDMPNSAQGSRTLYILVVGCIPFYGSTKSGHVYAAKVVPRRLKNLNRRTIDVLAARLNFYYSISYELTGDLAEIRGENFRSNAHSIRVQSQLSTLAGIMKAVDPKLHQHLGMADPARRKR
ncbi:hypothetical protein ACSBR2_036672 [Camellia fascicularis]